MRRHCGHHIRHVHLSVRHCSHAPFHPVGIICGTGRQTQETPWHVADHDSDVPDRGRIHSALSRNSSHSGGRCALCKCLCSLGGIVGALTLQKGRLEFHDIRVCSPILDTRRGAKPQRSQETGCWRDQWCRGANMHLSLVSSARRSPLDDRSADEEQ